MITTLDPAIPVVAVLIAAFAQGVTGFGFALVSTPMLLWVYEPREAIVLVILLSTVASAVMSLRLRREVNRGLLLPLTAASVAGSYLGALALGHVEHSPWFKPAVAAFVAAAAVVILSGYRRPIRNEAWGGVAAGAVSGFLSATTSLGGPPVVVLLSNQGHRRDRFRATISTFFALTGLWAVAFLVAGAGEEFKLGVTASRAAVLFPTLFLGQALGVRLARKVSEDAFRKVIGLVILLSSLNLALRAVW